MEFITKTADARLCGRRDSGQPILAGCSRALVLARRAHGVAQRNRQDNDL
jgi:hypothetical protein